MQFKITFNGLLLIGMFSARTIHGVGKHVFVKDNILGTYKYKALKTCMYAKKYIYYQIKLLRWSSDFFCMVQIALKI